MDSETIREAVETWRRSMSGFGDPEEAGRADAVLHRAALRYADLLEAQEQGEAVVIQARDGFYPVWACDALEKLLRERGCYPEGLYTRRPKDGVVGSEEILDALFDEAWHDALAAADREEQSDDPWC